MFKELYINIFNPSGHLHRYFINMITCPLIINILYEEIIDILTEVIPCINIMDDFSV